MGFSWKRSSLLFALVFVLVNMCSSVSGGSSNPPILLMHGFLGNVERLAKAKTILENALPNATVVVQEIGNGRVDSVVLPVNTQLSILASAIKSNPLLQDGFHAIGYSQGALLLRGYIERYNDPPVLNYISWVGPHMGTYGIPWETDDCMDLFYNRTFCDLIEDKHFDNIVYTPWIQDVLSFSNYWNDPHDQAAYVQGCTYLPDVNNLVTVNPAYKARFTSLKNFVMMHSSEDRVVVPNVSTRFEFWAPNSTSTVVPLHESDLYQQDWIGLKTLDTSNRLHIFQCACPHMDYESEDCYIPAFTKYIVPFLQ